MRYFIIALTLIIDIILQSTLFQSIQILNTIPNTAIIIIVSFAFLRGEIEGAVIGFCAGLLQDIFFGKYIGMHALLGMFTGFLCGKFYRDFYKESFIIPLLLTIASTFLYELLFYIFNILLLGYTDIFYFMKSVILPEVVYTALISVFLYKLFYIINAKLEKRERIRKGFF